MESKILSTCRPIESFSISWFRNCLLLLASMTWYSSVGAWSLTGTVVKGQNAPVGGADVRLLVAGVQSVTSSTGRFTLKDTSSVLNSRSVVTSIVPTMKAGSINFSVIKSGATATLTVMALDGSKVLRRSINGLAPGVYSAPVCGPYADGIYLVRFEIDGRSYMFRYADVGNTTRMHGTIRKASPRGTLSLAKAQATVDTLRISKDGFATRDVLVTTYATDLDTILIDSLAGDFDGDSLTDVQEQQIGTSSGDVDSDGDGVSDYVEWKHFNANNPFVSNPLVADLPGLVAWVSNVPEISIKYTTSSGQTKTFSNSSTQGSVARSTSYNSYSTTNSIENYWSVTAGAKFESGILGKKFTAYVEGTTSQNTFDERTHTWSLEEMKENSNTFQSSESYAASEDLTETGGSIRLPIRVRNTGNIAYQVASIAFTAYETMGANTYLSPFMTVSVGNTLGLLQPGQETDLVFTQDIDLGTAKRLLQYSRPILARMTGLNMTYNGKGFEQIFTDVHNRTATLIIDYGPRANLPTLRLNVAVLTDFDRMTLNCHPINMKQIMKSIQYQDRYTVADQANHKGPLVRLGNVVNDTASGMMWIVSHTYYDADSACNITRIYGPKSSENFDDIVVNKQDVVQIAYVEDRDGDGLLAREELLWGTSDTLVNTDGDDMNDGEEVRNNRNPLVPESQIQPVGAISSVTFKTMGPVDGRCHQFTIDKDAGVEGVLLLRATDPTQLNIIPETGKHDSGSYIGGALVCYNGDTTTISDRSVSKDSTYYYKLFPYNSQYRYGAAPNQYMLADEKSVTISGDDSLNWDGRKLWDIIPDDNLTYVKSGKITVNNGIRIDIRQNNPYSSSYPVSDGGITGTANFTTTDSIITTGVAFMPDSATTYGCYNLIGVTSADNPAQMHLIANNANLICEPDPNLAMATYVIPNYTGVGLSSAYSDTVLAVKRTMSFSFDSKTIGFCQTNDVSFNETSKRRLRANFVPFVCPLEHYYELIQRISAVGDRGQWGQLKEGVTQTTGTLYVRANNADVSSSGSYVITARLNRIVPNK